MIPVTITKMYLDWNDTEGRTDVNKIADEVTLATLFHYHPEHPALWIKIQDEERKRNKGGER